MDPFDILGVPPDATAPEIEARYRLLIREYHPDLHQAEGPDAVASAQQMTQRINVAMDAIRNGATRDPIPRRTETGRWNRDDEFFGYQRPPEPPPPTSAEWYGDATQATDEPVPCPYCGRPFMRLADYEQHLADRHGFRRITERPAPARRRLSILDTIGKVRYVPAWMVGLFTIASLFIFPLPWKYYVFIFFMCFLALVLWAQTTPRFKSRRGFWS